MKNKGKTTLKDIAKATNLSVNTVSKVINKKPYYTKEVEKKVLDAVKKMGYIPNSIATSLRRGSSRTIAIVFDDLINPYYSMMTLAFAQKLSQVKYDIMIFSNYGESTFLDYSLLSKIISRKVDAIISFLEPLPEVADAIGKLSMPFMLFGRTINLKNIVSVFSDDFEGGRLATKHLIEYGHKKIAYIGAHPEISADRLRFAGYKHALAENGIEFCPQYTGYFSDSKSIELLTQKVILNSDVSAIFCFNDIFSYGIIKELHEHGYKLPQDYSLVGFDNIQKYLTLPFNITTVSVDNEAMVDLSVKIILAKIQNPKHSENLITPFPVQLINGTTTSKPKRF